MTSAVEQWFAPASPRRRHRAPLLLAALASTGVAAPAWSQPPPGALQPSPAAGAPSEPSPAAAAPSEPNPAAAPSASNPAAPEPNPAAAAPSASNPAAPAPSPGRELRGRVIVGGLDVPLPGVEVRVRGAGREWRVTTDIEGRFRLGGLAPGRYEADLASSGRGSRAVAMLGAGGAEVTLTMASEVVEMTGRTEAERLRESSEAVQVVTTEVAQREAADLGDVLARSDGILAVQRAGGLGSEERFSLDGFGDEQVRFFVDGVPLEAAGFGPRLANIPVNLVDRVEVYRGVVPVRFGADALGGAVNMVSTEAERGTQALASYQLGSFGTHRLALSGRVEHEPSGAYVRGHGFYDTTDNDYKVDVEVPGDDGRLVPARVRRFHDGYRAAGGSLEVGRVSASGSDEVSLRGYLHDFDKDLQHNLLMTVPYGDVTQAGRATGGVAQYRSALTTDVSVAAVLAYAYRRIDFEDLGNCYYDWFGVCFRERRPAGEIGGAPDDLTIYDQHGLARVHLDWSVRDGHALRLSLAPSFLSRTGENHLVEPGERDDLAAERHVYTGVAGLEYQLGGGDDALENTLFAKVYGQRLEAEEPLPGDAIEEIERTTVRFGAGDGIRYRFADWLWAKASYELATRLPDPKEVLGDGARVTPNLELSPESSHNVNAGVAADLRGTAAGAFYVDANAFGRFARNLIVLLGNDQVSAYQNVFGVRALGVQGSLRWRAPGEYVSAQLGGAWQDIRNASSEGAFGEFDGDRIPSQPYLFGNGRVTLHADRLLRGVDGLTLSWTTRYVHGFYRAWESAGLMSFKQDVPSQIVHGAVLNAAWQWDERLVSLTLEAQNLSDAQAYDVYGVQRPGRALFAKMVATFR